MQNDELELIGAGKEAIHSTSWFAMKGKIIHSGESWLLELPEITAFWSEIAAGMQGLNKDVSSVHLKEQVFFSFDFTCGFVVPMDGLIF